MANLSQLILPVKDTITGEVTSQTFDLAGSGGDNTNFIGTREAYDALPASEKAQYNSMDFTNYQDGALYDPVPVKASHNIVESGGVYNAIANSNNVVAPVELTLTSTRAYAVGDQFVYDGLLYKATAAIGEGGAITIGTNCELADCVTKQISTVEVDSVSTQYGSFQVRKCGKIISIYGYLSGMPTTNTTISLSLGTKYRSATSYAIAPLLASGSPYAPSGSVWLYSNGTLGVYKPASQTSGHIFLTYVCN